MFINCLVKSLKAQCNIRKRFMGSVTKNNNIITYFDKLIIVEYLMKKLLEGGNINRKASTQEKF